jgi:hypothetical protein
MSLIFRMKYFLLVILPFMSLAQSSKLDSLNHGKSATDSVAYSKLKKKLSKSRFGRDVYDALFRDVYNSNPQSKEINSIEINPFEQYEGKIIDKIIIKSLEIFGPTVNDSTRKGNRLEHFASKAFHTNTREEVIRNSFLLFKEGDKLNPEKLKENERLIRANAVIHDARIIVIERKDKNWMVDILVLVQDVWSLNIDFSGSSFKDFRLGLEERNFKGLGHSFLNKVTWRANDPYQKLGFRSIYTIPYLSKTFITGQGRLIQERDLTEYSLRIFRPFLTTQTQNAGTIEVSYNRIKEYKRLIINNIDSLFIYDIKYYYSDLWYGRAFKIDANHPNKRLVLAIRRSNYEYKKRPEVSADTNKLYWNRKTWLGSIGFSNRNYQRDFLIYGFGRTEDVPVGGIISLTGGIEDTEFGRRSYGGLQYAKGMYFLNKSYLYTLVQAGSYIKASQVQQGVIGIQNNFFSNLIKINKFYSRHFINFGFTYGINRDNLDYLNISDKNGIAGVNSQSLVGHKSLTLGYEMVLFSNKSLVGFRLAYFGYASFGLVAFDDKSLFSSKLYQGYGLGIRVRNENLIFNTFQIRVGYYPNIPAISSPFRFAFDTPSPLRFRDFDISAPSILPLQ